MWCSLIVEGVLPVTPSSHIDIAIKRVAESLDHLTNRLPHTSFVVVIWACCHNSNSCRTIKKCSTLIKKKTVYWSTVPAIGVASTRLKLLRRKNQNPSPPSSSVTVPYGTLSSFLSTTAIKFAQFCPVAFVMIKNKLLSTGAAPDSEDAHHCGVPCMDWCGFPGRGWSSGSGASVCLKHAFQHKLSQIEPMHLRLELGRVVQEEVVPSRRPTLLAFAKTSCLFCTTNVLHGDWC